MTIGLWSERWIVSDFASVKLPPKLPRKYSDWLARIVRCARNDVEPHSIVTSAN